jgi:hypothetical protein
MNTVNRYRFSKCYDVRSDLTFFEVLDETDSVLMDVSKSEDGEFRVLFYKGCISKSLSVQLLEEIIREGKKLIVNEED